MSAGRFSNPRVIRLLLVAVLVLTAAVYWPSLRGGYVFDDYLNILQNRELHLRSLTWDSLREAALSSPSPLLIRPLAMLSFGLDWYLAGGSPYEMKLVNLAIHLLNGLLLFALMRRVARLALARKDPARQPDPDLLALCVTAAWLLAPINFTAVSYIVQRMESLCQVFVLAGLWGYVAARERMISEDRGFLAATASLALGTGLGLLSKESAVLLPLYAFAAECLLFGFAGRSGGTDKRLHALYLVLLFIPGCFAIAWVAQHALLEGAWVNRPFTLGERLLTEPRILFDYITWSLLPTPNALALYHDYIPVSKSLLNPVTTLTSIVGLGALAAAPFLLRKTRVLAALGIAWFLCGHVLTATVIPLELVFEHRNYFASIGLYLAVFSLLFPAPGGTVQFARAVACAGLLALFTIVTLVRALDWSNPITFALSEAGKNPNSPRTAYELARTYVVLAQYDPKSPLIPEAYAALRRAATMPGADALPDQALLLLDARLDSASEPAVWARLQDKLANQPLSAQNISALYSLSQCAIGGDCDFPRPQMVATFGAALKHQPAPPQVLSIYANYAINVLHDATLAIELAQESIVNSPYDLQARRNLMLLLDSNGRPKDAVGLYEQTLRDVPGAAANQHFVEWSRRLLDHDQPTGDAVPPKPE